MLEFTPFPKIGRLRRAVTITEKLDGTNAAVRIVPLTKEMVDDPNLLTIVGFEDQPAMAFFAQSRNKFVTPGKTTDNYGFAAWVFENAENLMGLGEGIHFGEWWGQGIQRNYGLTERRFSLFNAGRWGAHNPPPACCSVVPVLYHGPLESAWIDSAMHRLAAEGSVAAPGFMSPEGIIVHHSAQGLLFKQTFEHDDAGKEAAQ